MMTYPMALAKQSKPDYYWRQYGRRNASMNYPPELPEDLIPPIFTYDDGMVDSEQCDIDIIFNPFLAWNFGNGRISEDQYDFQLKAARQITHGLGIYSNLELDAHYPNKYSIMDPSTTFLSYMSPWDSLVYGVGVRGNIFSFPPRIWKNTASFLESPSGMASYIPSAGEKRPLSYLINKYQYSGLYGTNVTDLVMFPAFTSAIERDRLSNNDWRTYLNWDRYAVRVFNESIHEFFLSMERESKHYTGWRVQLNGRTFLDIEGFRDRVELATRYEETEEFLMSSAIFRGQSLENLMNEQNNGKLYGPKTLRVLEEIGHATLRNPQTLVFYGASNSSTGFVEQDRISQRQFKLRK